MKLTTRVLHGLLATATASALGLFAHTSSVQAGESSQSHPVTVVGSDSDGNPIYETEGADFEDPEENPATLSNDGPYPDVDNTINALDPGGPTTCKPSKNITVRNLKNTVKVDWPDQVDNRRGNTPVTFEVTAEVSTEFNWHLSGSVSAEFGTMIFAKVSATINTGISWTKRTTYGSKISVTVEPNKLKNVDRGMKQEKFGYSYRQVLSSCAVREASGTGLAPWKQAWVIYDG